MEKKPIVGGGYKIFGDVLFEFYFDTVGRGATLGD